MTQQPIYCIADGPVAIETPPEMLDADFGDILTGYVEGIISRPPIQTTQMSLILPSVTLVAELGGVGETDNCDWVPDFLTGFLRDYPNEPVRDVSFISPVGSSVVMMLWDAMGEAYCAHITRTPFGPLVGGHGHLPRRDQAAEVVDLAEAVGHYLWGPAWTPVVPEEDRC